VVQGERLVQILIDGRHENARATQYPDTPFLNFDEFVRDIQDICGGILVTRRICQYWEHTELRAHVERYMGGAGDCEHGSVYCGQIGGRIRTIKSAREVIEDMIAQAGAVVESFPYLLRA
jgi:hypothetical protein